MERVDILERGERHRGEKFEGVGEHGTTSNGDWFWSKLRGHCEKKQRESAEGVLWRRRIMAQAAEWDMTWGSSAWH